MERIIWSYSVFLQGMVVSVNSKDKMSFSVFGEEVPKTVVGVVATEIPRG
jgi:hypothetical protein